MFKYLEVNFKFYLKNKINEWIISGENNNYINEYFLSFYFFKILMFFNIMSTKTFTHVLDMDHVYGGINLFKYFYNSAPSFKTHCKII
jgi:hypothetical protein